MRFLGTYLNDLNEKYKCNTPAKTVKTTQIMLYHRPNNEVEMVAELQKHTGKRCDDCKEQCNNHGLPGWADMIYMCVLKEQRLNNSKANFTKKDCVQFVYELYVKSPLQGYLKEKEAMALLRACGHHFVHATPYQDIAYAVDLVNEQCAVQVKPISYLRMHRMKVHVDNEGKNKQFGKPVFYLYYCRDMWTNLSDVLFSICALQRLPYERLF